MTANLPHPAPRYLVACLCAAWCDTCREYRAGFEALAARFADTSFRWVDIEDEADWLGDIEVENFPTLLILHDDAVLFFGPMLPQHGILERTFQVLRNIPADALPAYVAGNAERLTWQPLGALRERLLMHTE
jgi:thiol-disulfide isomerase/thioredoxin